MATSESTYGPKKGVFVPCVSTERGCATQIDINGTLLCYGSGPCVIVRDLNDAGKGMVYLDHKANVSVARFCPSGKYIASGDVTGKIRVWAYTHPEYILKKEVALFAEGVVDLSWGPENRRITAVGKSRGITVRCFQFDTGSNLGDMAGHTKNVITASMKPTRPYRVVTGGEDFKCCFWAGPPFRFHHSVDKHTNYVNCVRYAPDGNRFVTVGSDKKALVFEGKEGEFIAELNPADMHKGSIYSCSWSPDGSQLVTSSADKSVKVWDMETYTCIRTYTFGETVKDMVVSVAWGKEHLVAVTLGGDLHFLSPDSADILAVWPGHQSSVVALGPGDGSEFEFFSGEMNGNVLAYKPDGSAIRLDGNVSTASLVAMAPTARGLCAVHLDNKLHYIEKDGGVVTGSSPIESQPLGVASSDKADEIAVITSGKILVYRAGALLMEHAVDYTPSAVALKPGEIAVGGEDCKVHIYSLDASITEVHVFDPQRAAISCLAYSNDGKFLAGGDSVKEVRVYNMMERTVEVLGLWVFHTTRITTLAWHPDNRHLASGSTDCHVMIWNLDTPREHKELNFCHKLAVRTLLWKDEATLLSGGNDLTVKSWSVQL